VVLFGIQQNQMMKQQFKCGVVQIWFGSPVLKLLHEEFIKVD
jgi:hypothetical protein